MVEDENEEVRQVTLLIEEHILSWSKIGECIGKKVRLYQDEISRCKEESN